MRNHIGVRSPLERSAVSQTGRFKRDSEAAQGLVCAMLRLTVGVVSHSSTLFCSYPHRVLNPCQAGPRVNILRISP